VVGRSLVLGTLAVGVILGRSTLTDPLVTNPGRAEATVLSTGTTPDGHGWAGVQFAGAGGPVVTRIAVSEPPVVGAVLPIVYDRSEPGFAARAAAEPSLAQALVVPVALVLPAILFGPGMLERSRRRRHLSPMKRRRVRAMGKLA
jgi:hypothetical protein